MQAQLPSFLPAGNASLATEWFHKLGYSIQMGVSALGGYLRVCIACVCGLAEPHSMHNLISCPLVLRCAMLLQINAADFLLDLASGDVSTYKVTGEQAQKHLITCAEKFAEVGKRCWLLACPFASLSAAAHAGGACSACRGWAQLGWSRCVAVAGPCKVLPALQH